MRTLCTQHTQGDMLDTGTGLYIGATGDYQQLLCGNTLHRPSTEAYYLLPHAFLAVPEHLGLMPCTVLQLYMHAYEMLGPSQKLLEAE